MFAWIQSIDWSILYWIRDTMHNGVLDFLMPKITALGNVGAIWIIAAGAMTVSKKYRKFGVALFVALLLGALIANVWLKPFVARPRPCWLDPVTLLIANPKDYSFPSGHTLASVIGAFILTAANRKFGYFAIPLAVLIAFSRLYLFVHFPSDVLTSVCLGLLISATTVWTMRKLCENRILSFGSTAV